MPDNKILSLYKKLLDIAEKEQVEIANNNIDSLEGYFIQKDEIIKEIETLNNSGSGVLSYRENTEIETIIKKILELNEKNIRDVQKLQYSIVTDVSAIHKGRNAHRAYISSQSK